MAEPPAAVGAKGGPCFSRGARGPGLPRGFRAKDSNKGHVKGSHALLLHTIAARLEACAIAQWAGPSPFLRLATVLLVTATMLAGCWVPLTTPLR